MLIMIFFSSTRPIRLTGVLCTVRVIYAVSTPEYLDQFTIWIYLNRARKSRTTLKNKVRLKVLPEQFTLFVNTSVTFKKCIIQ